MMWICPNDKFGYCRDIPIFKPEHRVADGMIYQGDCEMNLVTCGRYQTLTESVAAMTAVKPKGAGK